MTELLTTPLPPYAYNLIALLFVLIFVYRGYKRGVIKEAFSIASLVLCIPLAVPFGYLVESFVPLDDVAEVLRPHIVMSIGGLIAYLLLVLLFFFISTYVNHKWKPEGKSKMAIQLGGALIGGLFAVLLVLIIGWFMLTLGTLSKAAMLSAEKKTEEGTATEAQENELLMLPAKIVGAHKEGLEESVVGEIAEETNPVPQEVTSGLEVVTEIMEDPEKLQRLVEQEEIRDIMEQETVQSLMQNEEITQMAVDGNLMGILNHPEISAMLEDPEVKASLTAIDVEKLLEEISTTPAADDQ